MKVYAQGDESPVNPEFTRSIKTVLVVEDEAFVRESTCEILQSAGYRVLQAGNAAEARKVFCDAGARIDLLVCDAVLPDGNGMRLTQLLHVQSPRLQTIVASGYPRSVLRDQFELSDRSQVLNKPYSAELLLARVEALLKTA